MNVVSISQNIFFYKFNTFSILTEHLSYHYGHNFSSLRYNSRTCTIFFPSSPIHSISQKLHFYHKSWQPQHMMFFLSLLSRELSSFHLKEAFYSFSLAYSNCCHYCSCTLGPLLNIYKIEIVTWTQALWYCHSLSDNQYHY